MPKPTCPDTWIETRGKNVTIGVIDTGCDINHSAFDNINIMATSVIDNGSVFDINGHGTFVSSIITKYADKASIFSIKAVRDDGSTDYKLLSNAIYLSILYSCDIVNISVGGPSDNEDLRNAIAYAARDNCMCIICAAGNNSASILYPAKYDETIAVGSINKKEEVSLFSSIGEEIDFVAIGEDIRGAYLDNEYTTMSGTSFSCPFVSSIAALCVSKHRKQHKDIGHSDCWNPNQIKEHLIKYHTKDIGPKGRDNKTGFGLIHANFLMKEDPPISIFEKIRSFFRNLFD